MPHLLQIIFVIDRHSISSDTWVLDTGCGSHICNDIQGLRNRRRLVKGESNLRVGNGAKVAAVAIETYLLKLPTGRVLELDNCFYVPSLIKNIVSISCLNRNGYHLTFSNNCCYITLNDVLYGSGTLCNGIYTLDVSSDILNIEESNKFARKDNQLASYMWHCRLGHASKKRMSELHRCGILESFESDSFDTCESCLKGKMTKLPFTGKGELMGELLGLVHTDICRPMSTQALGGYRYFITFTDDRS